MKSTKAHMINSPPWMDWVKRELGNKEKPGIGSNPRILEYRKIGKIPIAGDDSKVPWCAIFVNAALEANNVMGTQSAAARSFISDKRFVRLSKPRFGCIVVFSSPSRGPQFGHVGFYYKESVNQIKVISGNSDNQVMLGGYPKNRLLGYFWPKAYPLPEPNVDITSDDGKISSDY